MIIQFVPNQVTTSFFFPMKSEIFRNKVIGFIESRGAENVGEYRMCDGGSVTLYASCFAVMALHYLGALERIGREQQAKWADYIKSWQNPETGLFVGPEIRGGELKSSLHDWDHITMHLTAHALPALNILGSQPLHSLRFAKVFLDQKYLLKWLDQRNWHQAWLEGNNLLFIGQFLIYMRDHENEKSAQVALNTYFDWLDSQQDPLTGLWGTNGYCDIYEALYGAYHQLLVYYYCNRPVHYPRQIINTVLKLQHPDGSFTRYGGGGTCEDVDAVDVLVNLYKRTGYRPAAVRYALEMVLKNVLDKQKADGGFVYRHGESFMQLGISSTFVPANTPDLFSTWFRIHTIGLICEILKKNPLSQINWRFNNTCSMGWHDFFMVPNQLNNTWIDFFYIRVNHFYKKIFFVIKAHLKKIYYFIRKKIWYD